MQSTEINQTEGAIWDPVLEPEKPLLTQAAARSILALDFPQADKDRMHELAAKARAGALLSGEAEAIDAYGRVGQRPVHHEIQGSQRAEENPDEPETRTIEASYRQFVRWRISS